MTACFITRLKEHFWWHHIGLNQPLPRMQHTHTTHMCTFDLTHGFFNTNNLGKCNLHYLLQTFHLDPYSWCLWVFLLRMCASVCVWSRSSVLAGLRVCSCEAAAVCPVSLAAAVMGDIMKCSWMQHTAKELVLIRGPDFYQLPLWETEGPYSPK